MKNISFHYREMLTILWPCVLLITVGLVGCPAVDDADGNGANRATSGSELICISDEECLDGETCRRGLCSIEIPNDPIEYGLLVSPPNSSEYPTLRIDAAPRSATDAELVLEEQERIHGQVLTTDGEPAPNGTLVVEPAGAASETSVQRPVRGGNFDLRVAPGTHRLKFIVDDEQWPRIHLPNQTISAATQSLDFEIPQFQELRTVTGTLNREIIDLLDLLTEPVEGASIVARGTNTGYQSPVTVTDEEGEFLFRLPPGDDTFDVLVSPSPDNPIIPYASFSQEIDANTDEISISLGELELDLFPVSLQLSAESVDGSQPAWDRYRVNIRRSLDLGELLVTPGLDESGQTQIELLLGTYDIEIISPPGAAWSTTTHEVELLGGLSPIEIDLNLRSQVTGNITDSNGNPVPSVRITTSPSAGSSASIPPAYTDEQGHFELWLDTGDHHISLRPPPVTGLPIVDDQFTVTGDENTLDLQLPRGFVVTGQIETGHGTPVPHTFLQAFLPTDHRIIGEAMTNSEGHYRFIFAPDAFSP